MKDGEINQACYKYGKYEKCIPNSVRNVKRRKNLEDLGVDGEILKEWIFMK
jgi:hypothetical protein